MLTLAVAVTIVIIIVLSVIRNLARKNKRVKDYALPADADTILNDHVAFYQKLDAAGKATFRKRVRDFLARTAITGVGTTVTETDQLLVAASAIIPIFAFPDWRYNNIDEVLLYKDTFNQEYQTAGQDRNVLGMVGNGAMNGQMILSQPTLRAGFANPQDGHNTAIHEFVHLIDKADGATDGVPEYLLAQPYLHPWVKYMHTTIQQMRERGHSDINLYGATNDAEFFAVVAEYFFENPDKLKEHHPELYGLLEGMFMPKEA